MHVQSALTKPNSCGQESPKNHHGSGGGYSCQELRGRAACHPGQVTPQYLIPMPSQPCSRVLQWAGRADGRCNAQRPSWGRTPSPRGHGHTDGMLQWPWLCQEQEQHLQQLQKQEVKQCFT